MSAATPLAPPSESTVDARNPWLGLASFTEETRDYFYGREEEVAELARRVQRKLLTVLFGQSGLGKTSILRAGLVPRLRGQGYCPVYVRIDYGREAPEPAEQIKEAIARTARRSGEWTQAGVAVQGESLWEFLHHRDDVLRDEQGQTLVPLLIFDQFEEIFTLAQSDDFGRARAARFIADLADLVENRPPKEFEARLEQDDSAAERFDFARSDYRVLISLREDYLAPLEGLKASMPSVTQNRLRLAPMTGRQALEAVLKPGRGLVSQEVAEAIVRFVAGGAEIANAEVEPSLLSLICRELNDTRLAQGKAEISLDLLAGSHETILANFYERSLADQPASVRRIIEDELLTESGFRENVAEERLRSLFAAAGAAPEALATLVNRRLLRIEERLDVRRVELTHDVLCSVVKGSRDVRHEREARDSAERLLAEQRERAQRARAALIRARQIATVCIVLALGAVVAAVFAYLSTQRARRAEHEAELTRQQSEQARGQAEQLLGYLTEDFARELEGVGRLDLVAELARRQVEYFKALPPALKGGDTTRNGARAMVYYARAMRQLGKNEAGLTAATGAAELLTGLQQRGDRSESTTLSLALALAVQSAILGNQNDPASTPTLLRARALVEPLVAGPQSSIEAKRAYVEILERLGFVQNRSNQLHEGIATLTRCMEVADAGGAHDVANADFAAMYASCAAWLLEARADVGQAAEARRIGLEALALNQRLLEVRPAYLRAIRAGELLGSNLALVAADQMDNAEAIRLLGPADALAKMLWKLDPGNRVAANNVAAGLFNLGDALWQSGRTREGIKVLLESEPALRAAEQGGAWFALNGIASRIDISWKLADAGDFAGARRVVAEATALADRVRQIAKPGSFVLPGAECRRDGVESGPRFYSGDLEGALELAGRCVKTLRAARTEGPAEAIERQYAMLRHLELQGEALLHLGRPAEARPVLEEALKLHREIPNDSTANLRDRHQVESMLALALAGSGKRAEAAQYVAPAIAFQRELLARRGDDVFRGVELAVGLYAEASADPARRAEALAESSRLLAALPPAVQRLNSVRLWRTDIERARGAGG
ncbi:MAG: hypothetical protein JSR54_07000 [Proteobacteria bacterium]|nr:hypothetical protein [Pseudomonadota bacterium]